MKIKDVCTYAPKSNIKAGDATIDGQYMFFTSSEDESKRYSGYQFDGEGIIMGTGGNATLHYYNGRFAVSTDCVVLLPDDRLRCKYLYYFFLANLSLLEAGFKGAGLKHTNKGYIGNIDIQIPPLEEQDGIVNALDRVFEIKRSRNKELALLDNLIKARFIEMFKGGQHPVVKAAEVCGFITKGTTPPSSEIYTEPREDSIPYLKVYNLSFDGSLRFFDEPQYISRETHEEKLARSKVFPNDVLMNIVGPPLGKFSLVTDDFPEWNINQAIAIFRAKGQILPKFLLHALMQPDVLQPFLDKAQGVRQLNFSLDQCRNLTFPLPDLKEQEAFCRFADQSDKSKFAVQNALDEAQMLFDSLMQKYFG